MCVLGALRKNPEPVFALSCTSRARVVTRRDLRLLPVHSDHGRSTLSAPWQSGWFEVVPSLTPRRVC